MKYELSDIMRLRPLERVFPHHLDNIRHMIERDGAVHKALIADRNTGTVLDGSHRYAFLYGEGYRLAPVCWIDYRDENIRVGTRLSDRFLLDGEPGISKAECLQRSASGNLFSPRTTRHFFPFRKSDIVANLADLDKGPPRAINQLLADADITEEIEHNRHYLREIDDELRILSNYIAEMVESRTYLSKQVDLLTELLPIGFFPGKFHPPHMGHVATILRLAPHYKKLIVGVTRDSPADALMSHDEIMTLLNGVLSTAPNVSVAAVDGVLIEKENTEGLPTFDVLLSGNPDVVDWGRRMQLRSEFVPRSFGEACSGESTRRALNAGA